jgi:hypothetical protein
MTDLPAALRHLHMVGPDGCGCSVCIQLGRTVCTICKLRLVTSTRGYSIVLTDDGWAHVGCDDADRPRMPSGSVDYR